MPSAVPIHIPAEPLYQSPAFRLQAEAKRQSVCITFSMLSSLVNTRDLPHTTAVLRRHLPKVLTTQCFNEFNRPFRQEVVQTEIGHLFEHILLRYLCDLKLASGVSYAEFSGRTDWNWHKDPRGTFHIHIGVKKQDWPLFLIALNKSIILLERILLTTQTGKSVS